MGKVYVVYDEFGLLEIHCMNCGTLIKKRDVWNGGVLMKTLSNFKTKDINITNCGKPSVMGAMLCADCVNNFDEQKAVESAMDGMREALRANGKTSEDIEKIITKDYTLAIEKKLIVKEIVEPAAIKKKAVLRGGD